MSVSPTLDTDAGQHVIERLESQRAGTLVQVIALLLAAACIAGAALLQKPINTSRKELQLVMQSDVYEGLPPKYAIVGATGGVLRGPVVFWLWYRADQMKEEGKHYEAHQLSKWICTLMPRFAEVWRFQAWNMSYNISVATHTRQERWQWVYNGIRLLRDEGIPNNERSVPLYHQLAWIWFHKVGDRMDDMHHYYKREWAAMMQTLLGEPPLGAEREAQVAWFKPVADAPRSLDELIRQHPGVRTLVNQLDDLGIDVKQGTDIGEWYHPLELEFFRPYTRFIYYQGTSELRGGARGELTKSEESDVDSDSLYSFFENSKGEDFEALLAWLRAKVLREQYKMDPQYMYDMCSRLSPENPIPIDWRTPWSQGLYWGLYGVQKGAEAQNVKEFDIINTDRIVQFALKKLMENGTYLFQINPDDTMKSPLTSLPDPRYIPVMHERYIELGELYKEEGEDVDNRTSDLLRSGHVNFLHSAVATLYFSGDHEEAQKYLDYLTKEYPDPNTGETKPDYLQGLYYFVRQQIREMADGSETEYMIQSLLYGGYMQLATGRRDRYERAMKDSEVAYRNYQKEKLDSVEGRQALVPFETMQAGVLTYFITNESIPLERRSMVWHTTRPDILQICYDIVLPRLMRDTEREGFVLSRAFPEPPGMAEYREAHPDTTLEEDLAQQAFEGRKPEALE